MQKCTVKEYNVHPNIDPNAVVNCAVSCILQDQALLKVWHLYTTHDC